MQAADFPRMQFNIVDDFTCEKKTNYSQTFRAGNGGKRLFILGLIDHSLKYTERPLLVSIFLLPSFQ